MNEVGLRPWRRVEERELLPWAGGRLIEVGRRIVKDGRVREMVRSAEGEVFATVVASVQAREHFAGVVMEVHGRRRAFSSLCSCGRAPCAHAVAVALALLAAVQEHRTPPRMARDERRLVLLPRPEPGIDSWDELGEDGSWVSEEPRREVGDGDGNPY